jgi:hypothetical protein
MQTINKISYSLAVLAAAAMVSAAPAWSQAVKGRDFGVGPEY